MNHYNLVTQTHGDDPCTLALDVLRDHEHWTYHASCYQGPACPSRGAFVVDKTCTEQCTTLTMPLPGKEPTRLKRGTCLRSMCCIDNVDDKALLRNARDSPCHCLAETLPPLNESCQQTSGLRRRPGTGTQSRSSARQTQAQWRWCGGTWCLAWQRGWLTTRC